MSVMDMTGKESGATLQLFGYLVPSSRSEMLNSPMHCPSEWQPKISPTELENQAELLTGTSSELLKRNPFKAAFSTPVWSSGAELKVIERHRHSQTKFVSWIVIDTHLIK